MLFDDGGTSSPRAFWSHEVTGGAGGVTNLKFGLTWYGDANLDGSVNVADLNTVLSYYGTSGGWNHGDFNHDGFVDAADLNTVLSYYNNQNLPSTSEDDWFTLDDVSVTAVPEPATIIVWSLLGVWAWLWLGTATGGGSGRRKLPDETA